jgi:negative regulator of sigma E activity
VTDCRDMELALSALHDGALAAADEIAAVRDHCATCASCSSFAGALRALDGVPASVAPAALADRIAAAVTAEALAVKVAAAEAQALAIAAAAAGPAPGAPGRTLPGSRLRADAEVPAWLTRTRLWTITGGIGVSAAAVVLALLVTQNMSLRGQMDELSARGAASAPTIEYAPAGGPVASVAPSGQSAPAKAPDYILYTGGVYLGGVSVDTATSTQTTEGSVVTALASSEPPAAVVALRSPSDPGSVVLLLPNGSYRRFAPVVRTLGGRTFQLQSGVALSRFGEWPRLISAIQEPTAADGSPSLRAYGTDSAGVPVYVQIGAAPSAGFAVAPGTATSDPAAGNPNWTWWAPLP